MKHLALVVFVFLAACDDSGGGKAYVEKKKPMSPGDEVLAKMEEFKDASCRCKDLACAEKVEKDMMEWAMKNMEMMKDLKPTEEQNQRADKLSDEMQACKRKLGE